MSIEEILDWVPPEHETKRITLQGQPVPPFAITTGLVDRGPSHTDLVYRMARPQSSEDLGVLEAIGDNLRPTLVNDAVASDQAAGVA